MVYVGKLSVWFAATGMLEENIRLARELSTFRENYGLQSRIESSRLLPARVGKGRLSDSVVLWVEVEDDLVSNGCGLKKFMSKKFKFN